MDDAEVVEGFLAGARDGGGTSLHIEGDVLFVNGYWHAALRLSADVYALRSEEPPEPSGVEGLRAALGGFGLRVVVPAHPLMQAVTYGELSLVGPDWDLWGRDRDEAEQTLAARITAESGVAELSEAWLSAPTPDFAANLEGSRRVAGLPPTTVLAVGFESDALAQLETVLPEATLHAAGFDLPPDACGELRPSLVLVEATGEAGQTYLLQLRASACGRFLAVAAVTGEDEPPLGADVALPAGAGPGAWRPALLDLLP